MVLGEVVEGTLDDVELAEGHGALELLEEGVVVHHARLLDLVGGEHPLQLGLAHLQPVVLHALGELAVADRAQVLAVEQSQSVLERDQPTQASL